LTSKPLSASLRRWMKVRSGTRCVRSQNLWGSCTSGAQTSLRWQSVWRSARPAARRPTEKAGGQATQWQTSSRWVRRSSAPTLLEGACLHSCTNGKGRYLLPPGRSLSRQGQDPDGRPRPSIVPGARNRHRRFATRREWLESSLEKPSEKGRRGLRCSPAEVHRSNSMEELGNLQLARHIPQMRYLCYQAVAPPSTTRVWPVT
jgi:hypothetical protein